MEVAAKEIIGRAAHQMQPLCTHSLKAKGRRAWLESAAAHEGRATARDNLTDGFHLFLALNAARPGHHDDLIAADLDFALRIPQPNASAFWIELTAGQLVGCRDANHLTNAIDEFNLASVDDLSTDHA